MLALDVGYTLTDCRETSANAVCLVIAIDVFPAVDLLADTP